LSRGDKALSEHLEAVSRRAGEVASAAERQGLGELEVQELRLNVCCPPDDLEAEESQPLSKAERLKLEQYRERHERILDEKGRGA
jgi:hypothetical protein